ncbi:MAG: hypothetical protein ACLVAA_10075 [Ruthenibacterium sp.]
MAPDALKKAGPKLRSIQKTAIFDTEQGRFPQAPLWLARCALANPRILYWTARAHHAGLLLGSKMRAILLAHKYARKSYAQKLPFRDGEFCGNAPSSIQLFYRQNWM